MKTKENKLVYILWFDDGKNLGGRYIDDFDSDRGTSFIENAKQFDTEAEALEFIAAKDYKCFVRTYNPAEY